MVTTLVRDYPRRAEGYSSYNRQATRSQSPRPTFGEDLPTPPFGDPVRRRPPDPAVRPTVGPQVTRRRSGTGRPVVAEDGRVRRPCPNQPSRYLVQTAERRRIVAWRREPQSPRWDNQIPCLVPHMGKGASIVRGLVSTRRGSEESGTNAPFWPGACATRLQHAAPFGSWLQGPGVNLQRATAMKPWKTSSATNETRSACPSFALIRNGLAMG